MLAKEWARDWGWKNCPERGGINFETDIVYTIAFHFSTRLPQNLEEVSGGGDFPDFEVTFFYVNLLFD